MDIADPSANRRGRRKLSCAKAICGLIAVLGLIGVAFIGYRIFRLAYDTMMGPNTEHFYKGTVQDGKGYVQPLVDRDQTFDIAVTVWLRDPADNNTTESLAGSTASTQKDDVHREIALFSDIVFRGLRMQDKRVSREVVFNLPLDKLEGRELSAVDLRGSFTLIPTSPSPLGNLSKFLNFLEPPEGAQTKKIIPWNFRAWPFPLGSANREKTLQDRAIDTIGTSVDLVKLRHMSPQCGNDTAGGSKDTEDDEDLANAVEKLIVGQKSGALASHDGKEGTFEHPHIITRTQVRLVAETRPFDAMAYAKKQAWLMTHPCGSGDQMPSRDDCLRNRWYWTHGHFESQFQIAVPQADGIIRTETRYAPYLDTLMLGYGPKDLVPLPVGKVAACKDLSSAIVTDSGSGVSPDRLIAILIREGSRTMPVRWHITFSARSVGKATIGNAALLANVFLDVATNATDFERDKSHDSSELIHGVVGHRWREDFHPRRYFVLACISVVLRLSIRLFQMHFWYNLTTTAGISLYPTVLFCAIAPGFYATDQFIATRFLGAGFGILAVFGLAFNALIPLLALRALLRLDVSWTARIPTFAQLPATHRERYSARQDPATWVMTVMCFLALVLVQYAGLDQLYLSPHQTPVLSKARPEALFRACEVVLRAADATACGAQALLNSRTHTYGGGYRAVAPLAVARIVLAWLISLPAVVGVRAAPEGVSAAVVLRFAPLCVLAWQAATLPPVRYVPEEEDNE